MGLGLLAISRAPPGRATGLLMSPSLSASLFLQHYASSSAFFFSMFHEFFMGTSRFTAAS